MLTGIIVAIRFLKTSGKLSQFSENLFLHYIVENDYLQLVEFLKTNFLVILKFSDLNI